MVVVVSMDESLEIGSIDVEDDVSPVRDDQ